MNLDRIISALTDMFNVPLNNGEQRKIIFWVDKDKEFSEKINLLTLENVKVHQLTEKNNFFTKYLLEVEDLDSHFLIYTNDDINSEDNWLIDTISYSQTFYADKISLLLNDLGIGPSLRAVVKKYESFFNKKNSQKFISFGIESFTEESIEVGIMSVLCNVKTPDFEDLLKAVLMEGLSDEDNKYIGLMEKYFDRNVFWKYVSNLYGYEQEYKSLKALFIHLTVTALSHSLDEAYLPNLNLFIAKRNKSNALVFIDHWMHHKTDYARYNELAHTVEQEISLSAMVQQLPIEVYKNADTFPYFDQAMIIYIANSLESKHEDYQEYLKLIQLRRVKHFYEKFQFIYEALFYAVKMYEFHKKYEFGIPKGSALDLWKNYVSEYHLMDTYYRKFYAAFDQESNSEILKKLKEIVGHLYFNWFMGDLSAHWSEAVETELKNDWSLPGITNQQDFYNRYVAAKVNKGERLFVIISDVFRYEVGAEMSEKLNAETMGSCEIEPMLSVIPSVTKMGMASLLPHMEIEFDESSRVLVDDRLSKGLENRKVIIESSVPDRVVVHAQEVFAMNKAARKEFFKGKKLIYIFHTAVDAMGDKASTVNYTLNLVGRAIDEISTIIKIINDDLSSTNILITAEHGYVYQKDALGENDKIEKGASLQEVVVPVIKYKNIPRGQANSREIVKVDIKLTNTTRKITNNLFHLSFFQMERVEEKVVPRTVLIFMADGDGTVISNEETIIGDRLSEKPEERTFKLRFALKTVPYDKNEYYYLTMKDVETGASIEKIPFTIHLGIVSDFDF